MRNVDIRIIILIVLLCMMFMIIFRTYDSLDQINEYMDNNEAIGNIASIYNTQMAKFDNLTISGDIVTSTISTPVIKAPNQITTSSPLLIGTQLCAGNICIDAQNLAPLLRIKQMPYMYSPKTSDSVTYNDIFVAMNNGVISRSGSPAKWDSTSYVTNLWNGYKILNIGVGNAADSVPAGIKVNVPAKMNVVWFRVLNCDRWTTLTVKGYPVNACGYRCLIKLRPNGGEDSGTCHRWIPYPVAGPGAYYVSGADASRSPGDNWISGIGFSTNPWNHAMTSGVGYYWSLNGSSGVGWTGATWPQNDGANTGDNLAFVPDGKTATLMVPVINSGDDKMLYFLSLGRAPDNNYVSLCKVTVNGTPVPNMYPCDNVFSKYYNNKQYLSYLATRVPASLITGQTMSVVMDATHPDIVDNLYFREVGTHDC